MKAVLDEIGKLVEQVSQRTNYLQLEQRNYDYNVGYLAAMAIVERLVKAEIKKQEMGE